MNKLIKYLLLLSTSAGFIAGCAHEQPGAYSDTPALYFSRSVTDTVTYSFPLNGSGKEVDEVGVGIKVMGFPSAEDRLFTIRQANAGRPRAAVAGVHYMAFDDPEMVAKMIVPAGKVEFSLPVTVYKDASLKDTEVVLDIEIVADRNFQLGIDGRYHVALKIADKLMRPSSWVDGNASTWYRFFGYWGPEKMEFIIRHLGFTDFDTEFKQPFVIRKFYNNKIYTKLDEYNTQAEADDREPLTEADGTKVVFPYINADI